MAMSLYAYIKLRPCSLDLVMVVGKPDLRKRSAENDLSAVAEETGIVPRILSNRGMAGLMSMSHG